ncbi:uncharacterized protein TNCV_4011731 [Trichonephila clavipes]|nr:uncharacterized protein TNCV_4011731 [Trichonephila clavipes]
MDLSAHYGEYSLPVNLQLHKTIDTVWMISHALKLPNVPMWVGFNSSLICNDSLKQIVSYLTPINDSPNNKSVVLETMKQSKKIFEKVKQLSIQVTYDLAIAKVALQIQATKKPDFDNLFIHLEAFHIMMAYFKAVGKVIIDCGLTNIMVQNNLLASGSVSGFLEAKHFNRSRQRWALSHDIRSTIISYAYKDLYLQIEQDVTAELTNHNIKNNIKQLQAFTDIFDQLINPFDTKVPKDLLINISYGKSASETVQKLLLSIEEHGNIYEIGDPDLFRDLELEKNVFNKIQRFICEVYNVPGMIDVDAARLQLFINTYMVSDVNEKFIRKNVKNFDPSNLPPCKKVDTKDADEDNEDIQYQHSNDDELSIFNDDGNEN